MPTRGRARPEIDPAGALRRLERLRLAFGGDAAREKRECLRALARGRLARPGEVRRLHEALLFLRAYPDDADVLARAHRLVGRFASRPDLRRCADALAGSGIAGTELRASLYAFAALWAMRRWGRRVAIDWSAPIDAGAIERFLPFLALFAESPGLDEAPLTPREWLARMKGRAETDAAFFLRRFEDLALDPALHEAMFDAIDLPLRIVPGPSGPSRGRERTPPARISYQTRPIDRRPAAPARSLPPPSAIRAASPALSARLLDLAREAMINRSRDLDAFTFGSASDVRVFTFGDGVEIVAIGVIPERRLLLESLYGYLILKNGVAVGYGTLSALFGSAEAAYNLFESYRGCEAGVLYECVLSTGRALFGTDTFFVPPYQTGEDNPEAIASGAWWFYQKSGFLPRDRRVRALMRRELGRIARNSGYRSSRATLEKLSTASLYLSLGPPRDDVMGMLRFDRVGLAVTDRLARRFGSRRAGAELLLSAEAARALGVRSFRGWSRGERLAWRRWSPLLAALPGLSRWSRAERRDAVSAVRAKGGGRESEFVLLFDRHRALRTAIARLASAPRGR